MFNCKRILHIFPSAYPGGSEKCALETIISLSSESNITQFAFFPKDHPFIQSVKPYVTGYRVYEYSWWMSLQPWPWLLKIKMLRGFYKSAFVIAEFIKENNINLVITHSIVVPAGAFGARKARCKHIWCLHEYGDLDHQFYFNYGKKFSLRIIDMLSAGIIVNSLALQKYFTQYFSSHKLHLVYYAVQLQKSIPPLLKKVSDSLRICMTGRIAPGKNQLLALEALSLLKKENILPQITFVGNANEDYLGTLKAYSKEQALDNQVFFTGQQPNPMQFVEDSDCVLVCSLDEAFGRVTIEGMKAGRVPVISNSGAGPEIVTDGETGYLFSPHDAGQLSAILKKIWLMTDVSAITTAAQKKAFELCNLDKHRADILKAIGN